jgi:hypothetical protein
MQDERLYSADGSVFLVPQSDGNLVLYNAYAVQQFGGTTTVAAIWNSGTYNTGAPQPFVLAMQQVLRRSTLVPCTATLHPCQEPRYDNGHDTLRAMLCLCTLASTPTAT